MLDHTYTYLTVASNDGSGVKTEPFLFDNLFQTTQNFGSASSTEYQIAVTKANFSFTTGPMASKVLPQGNSGYTNGIHTNVSAESVNGTGTGMVLSITVVNGKVQNQVRITDVGTGFEDGELVRILGPGGGGIDFALFTFHQMPPHLDTTVLVNTDLARGTSIFGTQPTNVVFYTSLQEGNITYQPKILSWFPAVIPSNGLSGIAVSITSPQTGEVWPYLNGPTYLEIVVRAVN